MFEVSPPYYLRAKEVIPKYMGKINRHQITTHSCVYNSWSVLSNMVCIRCCYPVALHLLLRGRGNRLCNVIKEVIGVRCYVSWYIMLCYNIKYSVPNFLADILFKYSIRPSGTYCCFTRYTVYIRCSYWASFSRFIISNLIRWWHHSCVTTHQRYHAGHFHFLILV